MSATRTSIGMQHACARGMRILSVWGLWIARRPLTTAALVWVGACSAKDVVKYPDLASFCNGRATAECSAEVLLACAIPTSSTCVTKRQAICASSAPAGTIYNPSSAESCVAQVSKAYADARITFDESTAIDAACLPVFDGPGGRDASCQNDSTCRVSTGLRCVLSAGSTQGTCQVPQAVQGGGLCSTPDARCVVGFHCGPSAHCDIDAALNETCGSQTPCGPGLKCSSAGVCGPKSADGTSCASGDECLHGICNKSTTSAMGLCVSQVNLAVNEPFCVDSR
jgi:hypothetical protein